MATNVDSAFEVLIGWLKPTEAETDAAKSHRQSISTRLVNDFGMTSMPRTGSFGHGTSVSGYSDIDYFAVIPSHKLYKSSSYSLQKVKDSLKERFPRTDIIVRSPAVVVPFGVGANETHEITPAFVSDSINGYSVYYIPDRADGWMKSSPSAHNAWVSYINDKLGKRPKQLIRLIKYWNYANDVGIRSFYLELRVSEYANSESSIIYRMDVARAFQFLLNKSLAAMQDPMGVSGYIYPCSDARKDDVLSKLNTACTRADKALAAQEAGNISEAFYWWDMVFNGNFPSYS